MSGVANVGTLLLALTLAAYALAMTMGEARAATEVQTGKLNGADGISDIEGKATGVGASERGQRVSFKSVSLQ